MAISHLFLRRLNCSKLRSLYLLSQNPNSWAFSSLSTAAESTHQSPPAAKPTSLSARMSFIFEQIDEIDKKREEKDETLQRIRAWRESKNQQNSPSLDDAAAKCDSVEDLKSELVKSEELLSNREVKKAVELVHPWPEWIELMERLLQQNYFDHKRKDEDGMMEGLGFDLKEAAAEEDKGLDFTRDFRTVQAAMINFGRDRFDILRSLSRQDLQLLVGYGCHSTDKKVVFSSKLLRKHVHLDEGDVCSSCSLRGSCEKAYLLTNKEDEARTIDVMRILLAFGFDPIEESVANKTLLKMKRVKTVVRKLLHEVVKLSAIPIDPNLPPPVIKKPPPKIKQPPPPPKKKVGRYDVEMKKGDWLCQKCEFMNFAKNTVCLQCDAKRPKRELLPGEWECPQCNFLNYRRNTACFHCEHKRPPDTYTENQFSDKQRGPRFRTDKIPDRKDVSSAWNFDFDDNESDGADVAAFEHADSLRRGEDFSLSNQTLREKSRGYEDGLERSSRPPHPIRHGVGFNDFDEEDENDDDVDSYELVKENEAPSTSRIPFSDLQTDSESEDVESNEGNWSNARGKPKFPTRAKRKTHQKAFSDSEDDEVDFGTDDDLPIHPDWKSSHVANVKQKNRERFARDFGADDGLDSDDEMSRSITKGKRRGSNGIDRVTTGRSSFNSKSFSEIRSDYDDDDEMSYGSNKRRDNRGGRISPTKASRDRGGMTSDRKRNKGFNENFYDRQAKNGSSRNFSKSESRTRGGGSFNRRGGRSNNFDNRSDSYLDDERYQRPRVNVR